MKKVMNKTMKKTLLLLVIALSPLAANARGAGGPEQAVMTVVGVGTSCGDQPIAMRGTIEKHVNKDKYQFVDQTGKVVVEIAGDEWRDAGVRPDGTVMLFGETVGCPGGMARGAESHRSIT